MLRIRSALAPLTFLVLAIASGDARAESTRELAAACLESSLDDLTSFDSMISVDCPALSESYGDRDMWVRLGIVGLGGTVQAATDLAYSCGGGEQSTTWEHDGAPVSADATFIASGHDTRRDVVYGFLSNESHFQSFDGPFEAARYVVGEQRLERLGASCLSIAVVASADAWVCDHGHGTATVGSLDLAARLPTASEPETYPVSMNDIAGRAFEVGRGVVLVRARGGTGEHDARFRSLTLPTADSDAPPRDHARIDTSRPGALVDLGLLVDGPFLAARLALLRGLESHGGVRGSVARGSVLELGATGSSVVVPNADVTARVAESAARLGLDPIAADDLVLGVVWSSGGGEVVAPLHDWAERYRAAGVPVPRAFAVRFRSSTATFVVEVIAARDAAPTIRRVLTPPSASDYRWSLRDVGDDAAHLEVETSADTIGAVLARALSVPMPAATEARLSRAESRIAARIRRAPRAPSEDETAAACDAPDGALRRFRFDLLAHRYDDCVDLGSSDAFADSDFADRFLDRGIGACRSGDEDACRVLDQLSYMFGDDPHEPLRVIDRQVCASRGGVTCLALTEEDPRDAAALNAVRNRRDRGVAPDCATLVEIAVLSEASRSTLEVLRTRACASGDADSCSVAAAIAARECESTAACDSAAALALHACELGSAEACISLRTDIGHTRHTGVPSGPRSAR